MIENNKQYLLIPVHEEGFELKSREMTGAQLKESFDEKILIDALDNGKKLLYKGNEYFLDEVI